VTAPLDVPDDASRGSAAPNAAYHRCGFPDRARASAFVAALARFVSGPRGEAYRVGAKGPVVWSRTRPDGEDVDLYLSDSALRATIEAFGAPPVLETLDGAALPAECALLYASTAPTLGMEQVDRELRPDSRE